MSVIRHVRIDISPLAKSESYFVKIDVLGPTARYVREQLIPSSHFGSTFDEFMSDAIEDIREEMEGDATTTVGILAR